MSYQQEYRNIARARGKGVRKPKIHLELQLIRDLRFSIKEFC